MTRPHLCAFCCSNPLLWEADAGKRRDLPCESELGSEFSNLDSQWVQMPGVLGFCPFLVPTGSWSSLGAPQFLLLPSLPPGAYLMVNASQHAPGQRAHVIFQSLSENDTHCVQFSYFLYSRDGHSPGTLGVYVRVNGGPLGSAVWNMTGSHGRQWHQAELAVSTFWPNEYQVGWGQTVVSLCLGLRAEGCHLDIRIGWN